MVQIVDKFIAELARSSPSARSSWRSTRRARDYLAEKGYDPMNGARPLGRVIQDEVKRPLSDELLFGKLEQGGNVRVGCTDDKLTFTFDGPAAAAADDSSG